jgi:hypothetical protein
LTFAKFGALMRRARVDCDFPSACGFHATVKRGDHRAPKTVKRSDHKPPKSAPNGPICLECAAIFRHLRVNDPMSASE